MWLELLVTGIITLSSAILVYFKWSFAYWSRRNVPYIQPSIPWGNGQSLYNKKRLHIGEHYRNLYNYARSQNWKYVGIYRFSSPALMPVDLGLLKRILSTDFSHFTDRGMYYNERDDPLSAHLFSLGGQKWRYLRKQITPTFTSSKIKGMFAMVLKCAQDLEKAMIGCNQPLDIKDLMARFTTDVIGECAFGLSCESFSAEESPFRKYGKKLFDFGGSKLRSITVGLAMTFPSLGHFFRIKLLKEDCAEFFGNVVKETIDYRTSNKVHRNDFLQLLMEIRDDDNKGLTMNEMAAQCLLFFLAGFETSSAALTFALFELARHPDAQEKARQECLSTDLTYESINQLVYTTQVIEETLRLYPAVAFVTRVCVKDYVIPGENVTIEKGTRIMIPILGIQHDSLIYERSDQFDPDRFSVEAKRTRDPYAFIPFGEGNRICLGMRFGLMQVKVGLTVLLKKYKFTLNEKTKLPLEFKKFSPMLNPVDGIWLNCEPIN